MLSDVIHLGAEKTNRHIFCCAYIVIAGDRSHRASAQHVLLVPLEFGVHTPTTIIQREIEEIAITCRLKSLKV